MRRVAIPLLSLLAVACTSEIDEVTLAEIDQKEEVKDNPTNTAPVFEQKSFTIAEHSETGSSIGFVAATDADEDQITYTLESEIAIDIDQNTGELKVGANLKPDFESSDTIEFSVSAFDGKTFTEKEFTLAIEDIDETTLLTENQKELITYFQHLVFWKGANNSPVEFSQKWGSAMKLHLKGTISTEFKTTVESVIAQYNTLFVDGDFSISLVEDSGDANANLFFGTKEEVEATWPDMFEEIKDGNYSGYAMTPSENSVLVSTRIWISNPIEVLLKHELGHALGFGHSDKCDDENSFLCSQISQDNDFLPVEKDIIRFLYHSEVPAGLTEAQIEQVLANLIVNEL